MNILKLIMKHKKTNLHNQKVNELMKDNTPWQLRMFQKTLKKKLRLKALKRHLGHISESDNAYWLPVVTIMAP